MGGFTFCGSGFAHAPYMAGGSDGPPRHGTTARRIDSHAKAALMMASVELAEKGGISYLVFECLAERTIAIAQQARLADPEAGFDPLLEDRMRAVLPACRQKGIRIISNMGAANPEAAARAVLRVAAELGIAGLKVAAVSGIFWNARGR